MSPFLNESERTILIRDGSHSSCPQTRLHTAMLLALDRGTAAVTVAKMARCHEDTVYLWFRRYLKYRDVSCLRGGLLLDRGDPWSRSRAVNAIPDGTARRVGGLSRSNGQAASLRLDAWLSPRAKVRLRAAILVALDRGARISQVARAAGFTTRAVCRLWGRAVDPATTEPGRAGVAGRGQGG